MGGSNKNIEDPMLLNRDIRTTKFKRGLLLYVTLYLIEEKNLPLKACLIYNWFYQILLEVAEPDLFLMDNFIINAYKGSNK